MLSADYAAHRASIGSAQEMISLPDNAGTEPEAVATGSI